MATPPDFTAGSVLTAAQMNAVGLWRITTCTVSSVGGTAATASNGVITVGTGNTSVAVINAFPSDYTTFKIVISNLTMSSTAAGTVVYLKMHDGTNPANTNYNDGFARIDIAATTASGVSSNLGANGVRIGFGTGDKFGTSFDVVSANIASHTIFPQLSGVNVSTGYMYIGAGMHQTSTAYTSFQIAPSTGTISSGTIRVYGYRN